MLNLASQINAIVPQTGDFHALLGNPGALPFDHFAGVPNTQAQGVDDRGIPISLLPQRGTMLARGLEHRICVRVSSAVELAPSERACDQRGHDGRGDSQPHQPERAGGSSRSCYRAGDQDDF